MDFNSSFSDNELREIEVLGNLLGILSKGVVKPNDPSHLIKKMFALGKELGVDLTEVINCCPPSNVVYEAKDFHSLRFKVLERLENKFS